MRRAICAMVVLIWVMGLLSAKVEAAELQVEAKSAVLMDAATGTVLLAQNEHQQLAPASVTKVMTMLLIMEAIEQGSISWEDTVIASEAAAAKGGSQIY